MPQGDDGNSREAGESGRKREPRGKCCVIATVAAAILFVVRVSARWQRDPTADAFRSFSTAAAFVALHSTPTNRPTLKRGSSTRRPSSRDLPLPEQTQDPLSWTIEHRIGGTAVLGVGARSAVARGFDATASPALG